MSLTHGLKPNNLTHGVEMKIQRRQMMGGIAALSLSACTNLQNQNVKMGQGNNNMKKPIIIAHRGASGYRPEHTLASYELAIAQNCDFIEPDLVLTKDGHLICRHENNISETTNVSSHPEFADRKTTKIVDGETMNGWFTEDFTLAEIKTLRAKERLPQLRHDNTNYDNQFEIPTFDEVLQLREKKSKELGREIGVYPETKHPSYFAKNGLYYDDALLAHLDEYGLNSFDSPVFIQSFETQNLKQLSTKTKVKLIQLMQEDDGPWDSQDKWVVSYKVMANKEGLKEISKYAYGIGPQKTMILPRDANNKSIAPTSLVNDAHEVGLKLHPWTFRAENYFLPNEFQIGDKNGAKFMAIHGDLIAEIRIFAELGIDGLFCDFPDIAFKALQTA